MARHYKSGLEYFSHDTSMKDDTKIKLLKAKFGVYGYGIFNLILEDIYKESYYLKLEEDYILLFESENNIVEGDLIKLIKFMLSKNLFDNTLFEKYSILTSKRIQQNYLKGCTRRKNVTFIIEYLLINPAEMLNETEIKTTKINYVNINAGLNNINVSINTQSKEKEIYNKEKKIKIIDSANIPLVNLKNNIQNNTEYTTEELFEYIWQEYPKRDGKKSSLRNFNATIKNENDFLDLCKSVNNYLQTDTVRKGYIKNGSTFFNNWKDFIEPSTNGFHKIKDDLEPEKF